MTAVDLPGHGGSPTSEVALLPQAAAETLVDSLDGASFDLLIGHSFGASVAMHLCSTHPEIARRLVLEELPGGRSVDWAAEAEAVVHGAEAARADPATACESTRSAQPRWTDSDCRHAVLDLVRCAARDVAGGLRRGTQWTPATTMANVVAPTTLLLAPDRPGINRLEDATALRGDDRESTARRLRANIVITDAGHCIHRDNPTEWIAAATSDHG